MQNYAWSFIVTCVLCFPILTNSILKWVALKPETWNRKPRTRNRKTRDAKKKTQKVFFVFYRYFYRFIVTLQRNINRTLALPLTDRNIIIINLY